MNFKEPLTEHVAQFAHATRYEDLPADVVQLGKKAILDCLGLALAGSIAEGSVILRRQIEGYGCAGGPAAMFGTGARSHARFAALANGMAMHSDEFDDTHNPSRIHPSAAVVAAVFAAAEAADRSGSDVLTAFNVGVEASCKISIATAGAHYQRGYHSTGSVGVFGATAAVCNVQRLPAETIAMALGIAGSEAAGVRENFGTMTKPLHAGRAAESAVDAAELAAMGFTATPTILEGPLGFFQACAGKYDPQVLLETLGNPWTIADPGIAVKPFPSGRLTHPAMCGLEQILIAHAISPAQVKRIGVKTNRQLPGNLTYHAPVTGLQGKFSMEFCLASILLFRKAGLTEFTDEFVNRADVQEAIRKIDYTCYSDEEAAVNGYPLLATFIEVDLADGRQFSTRVDVARGSPPISMTEEEVTEKFRQCAAYAGWRQARSEKIIKATLGLENLAHVTDLTSLLLRTD